MANSYLSILALRVEPRLQCPRCKRYNLVRSDKIDIYLYCPDISCGYVIRNGVSTEDHSLGMSSSHLGKIDDVCIQSNALRLTIGNIIDDAMHIIKKNNRSLRGIPQEDFFRYQNNFRENLGKFLHRLNMKIRLEFVAKYL